jgi:release factor glutamine methyltransferase
LFAGPDGLDDYRLIVPKIGSLLAADGLAVFEIGCDQAEAVGALAEKAELTHALQMDLAGKPRCLLFRKA